MRRTFVEKDINLKTARNESDEEFNKVTKILIEQFKKTGQVKVENVRRTRTAEDLCPLNQGRAAKRSG